jgi:excisionase family DNA binding protein
VAEQYHTVEQIATMLQVVPDTVYRWIKEGKLKAVKAGRAVRVSDSALQEFLKPAPAEGTEEDSEE